MFLLLRSQVKVVSKLFFILFLLSSISGQAANIDILTRGMNFEADQWSSEPIYYYKSLGLPNELSRSFLTMNLQSFYDQYYNVSFKHIGDWRDFDHGHLLKDATGALRGVLFHTQERASLAKPDSDYTFIDKSKRNWLLFTHRPFEFHNAYKFRFTQRPAFWNQEYEKNVSWDEYAQAGTVVELMLDPEKIGFKIVPFMSLDKTEAFYFKKAKCPDIIKYESNIIEIKNHQGQRECLYVTTMQCQFKHHFACPGKMIPGK